ncbi:hypothetical protein ACFWAA_26105 [Streptomyces sp. NPDC059922]|uniref:hypothetical protein n=1 Tax=Streptomyces sp. NPDC059922 TaxID=3347005 RepID=UPI00365E0A61
MRAAFTDRGYELVGVDPAFSAPWVAAAPTNATVTRVLAELGACVRTWGPARDANGAPRRSVTVNTVRDGVVDPASGRAYLSFPWEDRRAFEKAVGDAVRDWLRTTRPRAGVDMVSGLWWLEPGTVDRLKAYVLFCDEAGEGARCAGDHAVVLTVDPKGNPVGDFQVIRDVRDGHGRVCPPRE